MAAICFGSIKGKVLRVVKNDSCGHPVTGASSLFVVSDGFVSVTLTGNYEDGESFRDKNAWGDICVDDEDDPALLNFTAAIDFCRVDPDIFNVTTGSRTIVSGASGGVGSAFGTARNEDRFSLEVWSKVPGRCPPGGQQWVYWPIPNLGGGRWNGATIELGRATFSIEATTKGASALWGDGSFLGTSYFPAGEGIEEDEHAAFLVTLGTPPEAACGGVVVP